MNRTTHTHYVRMYVYTYSTLMCVQWNLSNPDTNGAEESVIVSEVSSFQRLKCMQEWYILGVGKGVLFSEVSSVQECPHRERGSTVYVYTHTHTLTHYTHTHTLYTGLRGQFSRHLEDLGLGNLSQYNTHSTSEAMVRAVLTAGLGGNVMKAAKMMESGGHRSNNTQRKRVRTGFKTMLVVTHTHAHTHTHTRTHTHTHTHARTHTHTHTHTHTYTHTHTHTYTTVKMGECSFIHPQ